MLTALVLVSLTQAPHYPPTRERVERFRVGSVGLSTLEDSIMASAVWFAPSNGSGMGAECAGTVPTASVSGTVSAISFTRSSAATCQTGSNSAVTAVTALSADQPKVTKGSGSILGLKVENAHTNSVVGSESLDQAPWNSSSLVIGLPTITADQATLPGLGAVAERVQIPAMVSPYPVNYSQVYQLSGCAAGTDSFGMFVKGNGKSNTFDIGTSGVPAGTTCSYTDGVWSHCVIENFTATGAVSFGNVSSTIARTSQDFFVTGVQCNEGPKLLSYAATTAAPAVTAIDTASISVPAALTATTGSAAMTGVDGMNGGGILAFSGGNNRPIYLNIDYRVFDGANVVQSAVAYASGTRAWSSWTGAVLTILGVTGTFDGDMTEASSTFTLGNIAPSSAGNAANNVITRVCLDPSPTRCR